MEMLSSSRFLAVTFRITLFLALLLLVGLGDGCTSLTTVAGHYPRCMRPTSYYVKQYCFEMSPQKVFEATTWVLKRYRLPIEASDVSTGSISTKAIHLRRYSCNRKWGYVVALKVSVKESKGLLSLKDFPKWVLQNKTPPLPPRPVREKFKSAELFSKAFERYMKRVEGRHRVLNRYVKLMKYWQGCNVKKAKRRTLVTIKADVVGYPIDSYGALNLKKPKKIKTDRTFEYATLREIGKRLGRVRFMPRILGRMRR